MRWSMLMAATCACAYTWCTHVYLLIDTTTIPYMYYYNTTYLHVMSTMKIADPKYVDKQLYEALKPPSNFGY